MCRASEAPPQRHSRASEGTGNAKTGFLGGGRNSGCEGGERCERCEECERCVGLVYRPSTNARGVLSGVKGRSDLRTRREGGCDRIRAWKYARGETGGVRG